MASLVLSWHSQPARPDALKHQPGLDLIGNLLTLHVCQDSQTELHGPARTAAGNDVSVNYNAFLDILRALGLKSLFEAVVARHLPSLEIREKAQNHAWSGADGYFACWQQFWAGG